MRYVGLRYGWKLICQNKKAFHNYFIEGTYQAGVSLLGSEVKSLRDGRVSLGDSYGDIKREEVFLDDAHISAYPQANRLNHEPLRTRKLLLHKREIRRLIGKVEPTGRHADPLETLLREWKGKSGLRACEREEALRQTRKPQEEDDGA